MKISADSTWGKVIDETTGQTIISFGSGYGGALEFYALMRKVLSSSQYTRLVLGGGTYTLSKKGEKILKEAINKKNEKK